MIRKPLAGKYNLVNQPSVAHALQMTLAASLAAALAMAVFALVLNWHLVPQLALVAATSAAVAIVLHRSGFVTQGLLFGIVGVAYAVMHAAAARDGMQSIGLAIIPMLIVIASLVLSRRGLVIFTALAILATVAMLAMHYYVLRIEEYSNNDLGDFLIFATTCATAAVIGQILARGLERGIAEERRESDEALQHSELKYRRLHESITDAVVTVDMAGAILEFNPVFQSMLGYAGEELRRLTFKEITPERWQGLEAQIVEQVLKRGHSEVYEKEYRRCDGSVFPVELREFLLRDNDGRAIGMWAIVRDITERKRAEHALLRQNEFIRAALENISDGVVACDAHGNLALFNRTAREWHGIDARELPPSEWASQYDLFGPDGKTPLAADSIPLRRAFNGEHVRDVAMTIAARGQPLRQILATGRSFYDAHGQKLGAVVGMQDITERKRAEEERERLQHQLAHAQKMESVGRLAGGVAHDFNNLMSIVVMHADSALEDLKPEEAAVESVKAVREAAERGVQLGRQLMAFSSKHALQREVLNLNSAVADSQKLVQRIIGEDIRVVFRPASELGLVRADRGQIGQIIMNLAVNSRDAMPHGGTFTMETANVHFEEGDTGLEPNAEPGPYVMFAIRDTGVGMDEETMARIFEPFFSTKGMGKGTGLGLSVVYGIVKQHSGLISVQSQPGCGTEFRIHLPVVSEPLATVVDATDGSMTRGSETILLAEDESALRDKVQEVLENAGYQVLVAGDGQEAYRLAMSDTRMLHLLLTDVVMPEMSGPRLVERLLTCRPAMKVLYMSGYPETGESDDTPQVRVNLIPKPFTKAKLLRRVRETLDGGQGVN